MPVVQPGGKKKKPARKPAPKKRKQLPTKAEIKAAVLAEMRGQTEPKPKPRSRKPIARSKAQGPLSVKWMGWEPGISDDDAKTIFKARYGKNPKQIVRTGGATLIGPLPSGA